MKVCTKCKCSKSLDGFHKHPTTRDRRQSWCKECAKAAARTCNTPESRHRHNLARRGTTPEDYKKTLENQNGVCAICGGSEAYLIDGKPRKLSQDHSHATGKARGILCSSCNTGIGWMGEDPDRLQAAAEYINNWI